jgi:hypothetical protein
MRSLIPAITLQGPVVRAGNDTPQGIVKGEWELRKWDERPLRGSITKPGCQAAWA